MSIRQLDLFKKNPIAFLLLVTPYYVMQKI